jgi:hypothetical protein
MASLQFIDRCHPYLGGLADQPVGRGRIGRARAPQRVEDVVHIVGLFKEGIFCGFRLGRAERPE